MKQIAIIGAGPAGLMAAYTLSQESQKLGMPWEINVFDAMPSVGRKFLLAGIGGLNLTHAEDLDIFLGRFGENTEHLRSKLLDFGPQHLREFARSLGVETFVGSSKRVFPKEMKAAPMLRAWLTHLKNAGVVFHARHRWIGWTDNTKLLFSTPQGQVSHAYDTCVFALGGGSWPKLGSDGSWQPLLAQRGVDIAPLTASNCGFNCAKPWSTYLTKKHSGAALKSIRITHVSSGTALQGECVVTQTGLEGSLIYALGAPIRQDIVDHNYSDIELDLLPDLSASQVLDKLDYQRGSRSLSTHLTKAFKLSSVKQALLYEVLTKSQLAEPRILAKAIKALPIRFASARPLAEAISSAGGVQFAGLTDSLMLKALPNHFCAGEMLDWDAPTGGYLLTASISTGRAAGLGVIRCLKSTNISATLCSPT